MEWKTLIVIPVAFLGGLLAQSTEVDACEPPPPATIRVEQDDTPECLEIRSGGALTTLYIDNTCDEAVTFEKLECGDCEPELTVEAAESGQLKVTRSEVPRGESRSQTYAWMIGDDREGVVETTVAKPEIGGDCPEPGACTVSGDGGGPIGGRLLLVVCLLGVAATPGGAGTRDGAGGADT